MSRVYRFRHILYVVANILLFPSLAFYLHNLRPGWGKWSRSWRNNLIRFGGWLTIRKWSADFGKSDFLRRLQTARDRLALLHGAKPLPQKADRVSHISDGASATRRQR